MGDFWLVSSLWPALIFFAGGFYLVVIACLFPGPRAWIAGLLSMPGPSSGSVLTPFDSMRGLSAMIVAVSHFSVFSLPLFVNWIYMNPRITRDGEKGVCMFCVLSGFLIYRSLLKAQNFDDLRSYCKRRFLRIFPLYIITAMAWTVLFRNQSEPWIHKIPADLLMLKVLGFYTNKINIVTWSLYVEVLFYITLPILMIAVPRYYRTHIVIFALVLLIFGDVLCDRTIQLWKYFLFGIIAYEMNEKYSKKLTANVGIVLFGLGVGLFLMDRYDFNLWNRIFYYFPVPLPFAMQLQMQPRTTEMGVSCALILLGLIRSPILNQIFSILPFRILGTISYSLFMWHELLLRLNFEPYNESPPMDPNQAFIFSILILLPALIFWSMVSFRIIERPFLVWSKSESRTKLPNSDCPGAKEVSSTLNIQKPISESV
jgi:peptidoglycan/LPS O-acetylase OafA/YrhL